jgi:hypothetical protein
MFPCGFIFRVVIPLDLVGSSSLVVRDSLLLVEHLDGMVSSITTLARGFRHLLSWET